MNSKTKILTIILIFIYLFICAIVVSVAQDTTLSVTGHVIDETTGNPVTEHLLLVTVTGSGYYQDYEFYTNDAGYYGSDSIPAPSQGEIRAVTYDCIGEEHAQEAYFNPGNYSFVFDFEICNDSIPQGDCENWFFYETWSFIDFTFFGESLPSANIYIWDFGDGNSGTGEVVLHSYDPNLNDLVYVTLTTIAIDTATGDSCFVFSIQEIWVGNYGGDCQAYFEYTVDSLPTGGYLAQFTDLSIGNPTFWMWEFGDGWYSEEQNPTHIYIIPGTYIVCLTIFSDSTNCYDIYCEEVIIGSGGSGDCENWFWYDTFDNVTFDFFGESFPFPAYEWLWDFGDGNTGIGQDVTHTFDPGTGNIFVVKLTTYSVTPGTTDTCFAESTQEVWIGNPFNCENWFWYETNDNVTFDFFGESFPFPADEWFWDFGDGETAYGQQVSHTFDPNQGDVFNVSLLTVTYDPFFGDSCVAISDQWVWVGNTMNCHANFYYEPDSLDELTVNFFDSSSGMITRSLWDFGDGAFSEESNPTHVFPWPGSYSVCLSVFSDTLGFYCFDTYCLDVEIVYSLSSNFSFTLDTISGLINNYYFTDISIGNADTWLWDFGDGNVSTLQNTTHQYSEPGEYEVCLEVSRSFPNNVTYTDTYCQTIKTPSYFDFGGQVFINNFPMNNYSGDTTIVDTGMAFLYRKYENTLIPVDTNIFYYYGYYWFTQVREGDYIVKVGLTENSLNYNNYATSYHEKALHWDKANTLQLYDTNYFVNVDLIELYGIGQGPGSISGFLTVSDKDFLNSSLVSEIEILLFDSNSNPLTFTITDESGNFAFENIPLGSYKLYAEATGFISFEVSVYLDENNQSVTNINLELYEQTIGTEEYFEMKAAIGNIYPNPVREKFSVDIKLDNNAVLMIDIFNISGQKVKEQKINLNKGSHILSFNSDVLPHGVYLLSIISGDRKIIETRKFVK